jgi:hypothetical protein
VAIVGADDELELRRVPVLRRDRDRVLVASGIARGERIVSGPLAVAVDGMQVRVFEEREGVSVASRESGGATDPLASERPPLVVAAGPEGSAP